MVPDQMFLVPWILLHALVVLDAPENDLAEAVKVGHVAHLRVEELCHEGARGFLVVDLDVEKGGGSAKEAVSRRDLVVVGRLTWVHLLTPYLTMSPLVIGADTLTI